MIKNLIITIFLTLIILILIYASSAINTKERQLESLVKVKSCISHGPIMKQTKTWYYK